MCRGRSGKASRQAFQEPWPSRSASAAVIYRLTLRTFRNLSHSGSGANRWAKKSTKVRIFAESRGLCG